MGQARDEAGNIWETDANGNPVRLISKADVTGRVFTPPKSEKQIKDEAHADNADARGGRSDARAEEEANRAALEFAATHLLDGTPIPANYMATPDRKSYVPVPGGPADKKAVQPTEFQSKSAGFYGRMLGAENAYSSLPNGAKTPRSVIGQEFYERFPNVYNTLAPISSDEQMAAQAQRNFISATLRQESGAAIGPAEFGNQYQIFFPMPGDSAEVIAQKAKARQVAMAGFKTAAGPSAAEAEAAAAAAMMPPTVRNAMNNPFFEQGASPRLLNGDSDYKQKAQIPPEMQQEHSAYLAEHLGAIDPQDYANFRANLDVKYGFAPNSLGQTGDNIKYARDLNDYVKKGGRTIPPLGSPIEPMSAGEKVGAALANNPVTAAGLGAASSSGLLDEAVGGINSLAKGTSYDTEREKARALIDASRSEHPISSFGGALVGSSLTGAAFAKAFPQIAAIMQANPIKAGGLYGGLTGAAEDNDNRFWGGVKGTGLGLAGGAAGKYLVAPAVAPIGRASADFANDALNRLRSGPLSKFVGDRTYTPPVKLTPTENLLGSQGIDAGATVQNLRDAERYGLPYALGDADPKLRLLSGWASRTTPEARALAMETFNPRQADQANRFVNTVDTRLAPKTNIDEYGSQLLKAADDAAGPSYSLAKSRPAPVDPQIAAMLDTPAGRASLEHARSIAANEGINPNSLGFDLNDQGEVILKSAPSFKTLQLVKRGFDQHMNSFADQFGNLNLRGNPMAQSVDNLRSRFNTRLGELNPDYAEGNQIWKGFADRKDALDMGYGVLGKDGVPDWQFDNAVSKLTPETMPEAQRGMATGMIDNAMRRRDSADPWKLYSGMNARGKIDKMFPEGAADFNNISNLEGHMSDTRFQTLGGPDTAARIAIDDSMNNRAAEAVMDQGVSLLTGGGLSPRDFAKQAGLRGVRQNVEAKANAIAPVLFDTSDPGAIAVFVGNALKNYNKAQSRKNAYGLLGAAALSGLVPVIP